MDFQLATFLYQSGNVIYGKGITGKAFTYNRLNPSAPNPPPTSIPVKMTAATVVDTPTLTPVNYNSRRADWSMRCQL